MRRFLFLFSAGVLWAPFPKLVAVLTPPIGSRLFGTTEIATRVATAIGDVVVIGLASIPLALALILPAHRKVMKSEWLVVLAPALVWAAMDVGPRLGGSVGAAISGLIYLVTLCVLPFLVIRVLDAIVNR